MKTLFIILVLTFTQSILASNKILIASDSWCPYVCDNKTSPGFMIESTEMALNEVSTDKFEVELRISSWKRSLKQVEKGKVHAVAGALKSEVPHLHTPTRYQGLSEDRLIVKKKLNLSGLSIQKIKSKNYKVGVIKEYDYDESLMTFLKNSPDQTLYATSERPLVQLIHLLNAGRIDILVDDNNVFKYNISKLKLNQANYTSFSLGESKGLYVAFKDKELAKLLDKGLKEIQHSKRYQDLKRKYNIEI